MTSLVDYPVALPLGKISPETDAVAVATAFVKNFQFLNPDHFVKDALWRDVFALTGTIRTFYSASTISAAWHETAKLVRPGSFVLHPKSARVLPIGKATWLQAMFSFETAGIPQTECTAILALVPDSDGEWRIWCLRTILEQLRSYGDVDKLDISSGNISGSFDGNINGSTNLSNGHSKPTRFDCVVIGGGQAGLSAAGRLKALGIDYVVLDKHPEVGDSWKTRYTSVRLHTSREYAHLPFNRTFPAHYPEWLSKDDLAQGYRDWVSKFGINIWQNTTVVSGNWDSSGKLWNLILRQPGETDRSISCSYVVLAGGGGSQIPLMPEYPNREIFQGTTLHSANYRDSSQWKGKHGVVVGTANTGHDIAEDMLEAGLSSVTMIQRSRTYVCPVEYYKEVADITYNATFPTDLADKLGATQPFAVMDLMSMNHLHSRARGEPERFDALERAGFLVDRYGNMAHHLYNRLGGHYMDVGASAKIAQGLIKVKSDSLPVGYTPDGLEFGNGTNLKADVIVFATGFKGNAKYLVEDIFGSEVAEQMGDYWTFDKEGEIKGAFKPTDHPAMWYHGGTVGQARYFSRFIALQIKAALLGTPLPVYRKTP